MFTTARSLVVALVAVGLLGAASVLIQIERDRRYATDRPESNVLYVQSGTVLKRLVLSYDALAADVYWIRAIQHYGRERQQPAASDPQDSAAPASPRRYELLYPLLDLTTTLDPRFNLAYRFGSTFLSEAAPGGPGRPDLAIRLLEKGIAEMPDRWQYYVDAGFVEYWGRHDYIAAARWFQRGTEIEGAPWWLKLVSANTLAKGGDRRSSRLLYTALLQASEHEFMAKDAARRLKQLDILDALDLLNGLAQRHRAAGGTPPYSWDALIAAGLLRATPRDPEGLPYTIDPATGHVTLNGRSSLLPLPAEPPAALPSSPPPPA